MKSDADMLLWPAYPGDEPAIHNALVAAREAATGGLNVEGVSVFLKIDGRVCLAPIASDRAELFIGMLPAFQDGNPKKATVHVMPDQVAVHVEAAGRELHRAFNTMQRDKGAANG